MLDYKIHKQQITDEEELYAMHDLFWATRPKLGAFDTETTGLHIICDSPFLIQFGWIDQLHQNIYTYAVDLEHHPEIARRTMTIWNVLSARLDLYGGHNITYDMHMLANVDLLHIHDNFVDTMAMIRFAHDNVPTRSGGVALQLKPYTTKHIDATAKMHDKLLQAERSAIAKQLNKELQVAFNETGIIPDGYKSWTVAAMSEYFKDPTFTLDDLPEELRIAYEYWLSQLPEQIREVVVGRVSKDDVPYNLLTRENVLEYAHMDIVYTLLVMVKTLPVIEHRQNMLGLRIERDLIPVFYKMERQGFYADKEYLQESKSRLRAYIRKRRSELVALTDKQFTISQSAVIKDICNNKYALNVTSTGAEVFDQLINGLEAGSDAKRFLELIQELRTLEKWYSTYLTRLEHGLRRSDKLFTQINSVGTASGRVTSDFQQFPKSGIQSADGDELFNPRRMVVVTPGYKGIVYMDYSQIELRVQALYTLILGDGDMNLCRAYMPFKCIDEKGESFDPFNAAHIARWNDNTWVHQEDNNHWDPVDLHGATTKAAFDITESHPDYKHLRGYGKRVNFAKNYGATYNRIRQMFPEFDEEAVRRIDGAYYKAFPGIKVYQDYCYRLAAYQAYATNLFNIRYWNVSGHNLINMLIQGSSAYFLKIKEIEIQKYLDKNNCKTVMQMNIHDEISFLWHPDDPVSIFKDIKAIMEEWADAPIPIVADLEITTTNWADKEDWEIGKD